MPTASETKDMHYKTIEKRIMTIKALEHFLTSKEFANFVSNTYQNDPFYYAMSIGANEIVQEIRIGVGISIDQLKEQVKDYIV